MIAVGTRAKSWVLRSQYRQLESITSVEDLESHSHDIEAPSSLGEQLPRGFGYMKRSPQSLIWNFYFSAASWKTQKVGLSLRTMLTLQAIERKRRKNSTHLHAL